MPASGVCCQPAVLKTFDVIISCFIIFPAAILYWSGTWKFLELNIYPYHPYAASSLLLLVGFFILITGYFALPLLEDLVVLEDLQRDFTKHLLVSKVFNYITALGYIFLWRGVWMLIELCFGKSLHASLIVLAVSLGLLLLMKSISNAMTTPFMLHLDCSSDFYKTAPRFRTQLTPDSVFPYSFDVLFTCLIVQPLTVALWVGLWNTFNVVLYPDNKQMSYLVSAGIGLAGALILFMLQTPTKKLALHYLNNHSVLAVIYTDIFHVTVVYLGFMLWRGCWGYINDYVLLSNGDVWLMGLFHGIGMGLLLFAQASRTAAVLRCGVDDETVDGHTPVELNVQYLRHFCRYRERMYSLQVESVDESQSLLQSSQYVSTPVYGGF